MKKIKLFCIPYAGGSAEVFRKWAGYFSSPVELFPVELAGRGKRYNKPLYAGLDDAVNDVSGIIIDNIDHHPYAFFGHSMGCIIIYELYYKLMDYGIKDPVHMFFSGCYPPHIGKKIPAYHKLPGDEFKEKIFSLGGTLEELLKRKALLDTFIPILKADFKIVETYNHIHRDKKLACDITVFNANDDKNIDDIVKWQELTGGSCNIYEYEGGHFFINKHIGSISGVINYTLNSKFKSILTEY